jgi:hypothetical protein
MVLMGLQLCVHVPQKGGLVQVLAGLAPSIQTEEFLLRTPGSGMIDSVSEFSLNRMNSNRAIRKPLLARFSRTGKKWKNLGQVSFKI